MGDGSTQQDVEARVKQIRNLCADTEQEYEREKLNERIARLSGGVAIIQVRSPALLPPCPTSLAQHAPLSCCVGWPFNGGRDRAQPAGW